MPKVDSKKKNKINMPFVAISSPLQIKDDNILHSKLILEKQIEDIG